MNARTRPTRRVFLSGLAVTLSGCGVMSRIDQPIPLYNLVAPISFDHAFQALDKQLTVGIPIASAASSAP